VELEPGPAYLAFFALLLFVMSAASANGAALGSDGHASHSLVGWPLALAIGTGLAAVWGVRGSAAR
jgi:hypothetical protein